METVNIVYAVIIAVAVGSLIIGRSKAQYGKGVKMAALWIAILAVVFGAVVYWDDFKNTKFYNSLFAGSASVKTDSSMEFSRASDGAFSH